jgi:hypothetical protein
MVQAIGYVTESFDPAAPGRLCRGRERWIEYETMGSIDECTGLHRVVLSGATFSDDRARDARRGLNFGPIDMWPLLQVLLGEGIMIAYCEEGHPHEVPESAANIEHHTVARPGGSLREWRVRWHVQVTDETILRNALNAGADVFFTISASSDEPATNSHESPIIPPVADANLGLQSHVGEPLAQALFLLTGFRCEGRPNRYFQPWGVPAVLEHASAVALVHRDKHGPALGVYRSPQFDIESMFSDVQVDGLKPLLVPFAIPPMLARWDRALWELRQSWDATLRGDFPVPVAESDMHTPEPEPEPEPEPPEEVPAATVNEE